MPLSGRIGEPLTKTIGLEANRERQEQSAFSPDLPGPFSDSEDKCDTCPYKKWFDTPFPRKIVLPEEEQDVLKTMPPGGY